MDRISFQLSKGSLIFLFVYYGLLFVLGLVVSTGVLLHQYNILHSYPILLVSIIGSAMAALTGNAIHYVRKLYRACINSNIVLPHSESDEIRHIGIFMYFLLRPIFSIVFGIMLILFLKISLHSLAVKEDSLSDSFIYVSLFLSFLTGYSTGDVIDVLEEVSKKKVEKIFRNQE